MTTQPRIDLARRRFLQATGAFSAGALFPALSAWIPEARAQATDYRALVCVFLYGGNDGNNMVVPYDDYAGYAAGRGGATGSDVAPIVYTASPASETMPGMASAALPAAVTSTMRPPQPLGVA